MLARYTHAQMPRAEAWSSIVAMFDSAYHAAACSRLQEPPVLNLLMGEHMHAYYILINYGTVCNIREHRRENGPLLTGVIIVSLYDSCISCSWR